ncbi:GNAT family N-acetyltransferase [Nonomuraea sp. NN258]|uniref:GNAT family N-acetyltransferase n=1 Tax=Nonomuraea antri TaxID=2730852 RepID=UPI00156A134E|nr:GNAT family protein [Nonomuraea antri]NRQ32538.1 GNAT family N-acetyltransferase [Nonomuraea antri]
MTPVNIRLRPWRDDDVPLVLRAFHDPEMRRQSPFPILTPKDAQGWIAQWTGVGHAFAVEVAGPVPAEPGGLTEGQVVGNVAVAGIDRHDNGWVSYWVVREARGRGIAVRATELLARWAFEERGLFRLELGHRTDNPASCRVATKAGFRPEGVERGKLCYDGIRYDVERHARLATD